MKMSDIKSKKSDFQIDLKPLKNMSEFTADSQVQIFKLPINKIKPYRYQARTTFNEEDLKSLAESIRAVGIRNPLTVLRTSGESFEYEVVSGERRIRAAKMIGLEVVPCIITDDEVVAQEIAIIENTQRQDLHPIELATALRDFQKRNPSLSSEDIYAKIGMSKTSFYRLMTLNNLSEEVRNYALKNDVLASVLYNITHLDQSKQLQVLLDQGSTKESTKQRRSLSRKNLIRIDMQSNEIIVGNFNVQNVSSEERSRIVSTLYDLIHKIEKILI